MYANKCAIVHLHFGDDKTLFKGKFRCDLEPGLKSCQREVSWDGGCFHICLIWVQIVVRLKGLVGATLSSHLN